jgi:spermidine/putrescine transport system permease protein/putrescine transport system permease protein
MRDVLGKLAALIGAVVLVGGVLTVVTFVAALASGDADGGGLVPALVGVALIAGAARLIRLPSLLAGYSVLVYAGLFIPILIVIVYAFNSGRYVAVWEGFSTESFSRALNDDNITDSILRSFRIGLMTAIVSTVLGTAGALALARARARTRTPIEIVVLLTVVVPEVVIAIAALIFFVNMGFELGSTTMLLGHCIFNTSIVLLIVRARFLSMGDTLEEASRDLGASPLSTFRQITLPRIGPAVLAGGLLAFTFSFDDVIISNFTSGAGNETWPLHILSALRFGLSPTLNAAAAMMIGVTLVGLLLAGLALRAGARQDGGSARPTVPLVEA